MRKAGRWRGRTRLILLLGLGVLVLGGCRRGEVGAQLAMMDTPPVTFAWSGALTPTSVQIVAGLARPDSSVRLVVATDEGLEEVVWHSEPFVVPPGGRVVRVDVRGLEPDTRYHYAFGGDEGAPAGGVGTFRTPGRGPFSFTAVLSSCAATGSSSPVFDAIRREEPLFFFHLGDAHYENIATAEPAAYRTALGRVLRAPAQARLYRSTPIVYIWDDHDFGPNDADRTAPGQEAARLVYRELVPHYPLPADAVAGPNAPIYHAFTIGRVRFIVTDLRSERDPKGFGDPAERTMMGAEQKAWFFDELRRARGRYGLVVWASTVPWIGPPEEGADRWGGYAAERRQIATFIRDLGLDNLVIVSGDAHMTAIDDGTNSDYATGGGAPIPVIQAAPLDRNGSFKGGPYSEGAFVGDFFPPWNGQWVRMRVEDDGGPEVCATWTGYRTAWSTGATSELVEWGRCFPVETDSVEVGLGG